MQIREQLSSPAKILLAQGQERKWMEEKWLQIKGFLDYSVSDFGRVQSDRFERILAHNFNQYGNVYVVLTKNGRHFSRSLPLLVADAFLPRVHEVFDTPINLDGDRENNHVKNLMWRPRWFAIRYNRQFREPYIHRINRPLVDMSTGEVSRNSFECAIRYGLLESDVVMSIREHTFVWPTYKQFRVGL